MTYSEKLRDPRWQKMRLEIMQRDGFRCLNCKDATKTLHVHHRYYRKNAEPWEYPPSAFITLCESCHESSDDAVDRERLLLAVTESARRSGCTGRGRYAGVPFHIAASIFEECIASGSDIWMLWRLMVVLREGQGSQAGEALRELTWAAQDADFLRFVSEYVQDRNQKVAS